MTYVNVTYEWCLETQDDVGDIVDSDFAPTLAALGPPGLGQEIVLVCDIREVGGGLVERGWAYVEAGKLPEWCTEASDDAGRAVRVRRVPKRFHQELATLTGRS